MSNEPNIAELAVAAWRLERWLDNLKAERKMAAKSSLRLIKKYLEASSIEIMDPVGTKFDPGLAIEVVNNESDDADESDLIIIETNSPIIKQYGSVIQYGRVILGTGVKSQKPNKEIKNITDKEPRQSKLLISSDDRYWLKKFEIKSDKPKAVPGIAVTANVEIRILLLDEKVFKEYCRGIPPYNPFIFTGNPGTSYVAIPYPDTWYMIVWPLSGERCSNYEVDMNFEWISEQDTLKNDFKYSLRQGKSRASEKVVAETSNYFSNGLTIDDNNDSDIKNEGVSDSRVTEHEETMPEHL